MTTVVTAGAMTTHDPVTAGQPRPAPAHFAYIDALRGIACVAVFTNHIGNSYCHIRGGPMPAMAVTLLDTLARGVQLFYVISAFTLFHSYAARRRVDTRPVLFFAIRRVFRIAPLFIAALILYTLTSHYAFHEAWPTMPDLLVHGLFLHGFSPNYISTIIGPGWSVGVEMAFYLTVPLLFLLIRTLNASGWFFVATVLAARLAYQLVHPLNLGPDEPRWQQFLFFWLPNQLPAFAAGIVLYFISQWVDHQPSSLPEARRRTGRLLMACFLLLTAALCASTGLRILDSYVSFGLSFVILALALRFHPSRLWVNRFTVFLGSISYGIYLLHALVIRFCDGLLGSDKPTLLFNFLWLWVMAIGLTIGASLVTYHLIELPGQKLGKRLIERLSRSASKPA